MSPLVTINLVVMNGEKYIRYCLDSVGKQTYDHGLIELNVLDNASGDGTLDIVDEYQSSLKFKSFNVIKKEKNIGTWGGFEEALNYSKGKYIVCLCVDVLLHPDFIKNAVMTMEKDEKIGGLQAKIFQWKFTDGKPEHTNLVDTLGFQIKKTRHVTNIAQGLKDGPEYNQEKEVFGVEGAVPVFRKSSFEDCRIMGEIIDHDMFWYGDDVDISWRMRMLGWKEIYAPGVIAYHDRSTTKSIRKNWLDYFRRVKIRRQIPIRKRRLDWRNSQLAILKNDFALNFLRDLPYIAFREIMVLGYALLFEQQIFLEIPNLIKLIPKMIKKRREIMRRTKIIPREMRKWFM